MKDHTDAMCCLGSCFFNGLCDQPVDYEKAFYWYQRAADVSNLQGPDLHRLSSSSSSSPSSSPSSPSSSRNIGGEDSGVIVRHAANDGSNTAHIEAWSNIASMYALGLGVPKCMDTAKHILRFLDSIQK
jgi:TPR repeat protein